MRYYNQDFVPTFAVFLLLLSLISLGLGVRAEHAEIEKLTLKARARACIGMSGRGHGDYPVPWA